MTRRNVRLPRRLAAGATVLVTALAAAACGGNQSPSTQGSQDAAAGGTLAFYSDKAGWKPQLEAMSAAAKKDVNIDLRIKGYSDANAYSAFIKQSFRTKESPGLFTWHTGGELKDLVKQNLLTETTEQWNAAVAAGNVPEQLKQSYTVEGKQYCLPLNVAYWVMFYNKSVFAKYGISEPKTWAELMASAEKLKSNGETPFYQTDVLFNFVWFQTLVAGTDPELYRGLSTGEVSYTDPRIVAVMNTWAEMMNKGYFNKVGVQTEPAVMLQKGDVAMLPFGSFMTANLNTLKLELDKDYGIFLIPPVTPMAKTPVAVESGPMCTAQNSPQKDLGRAYADWSLTPQAQTVWAKESGQVSFNPKAIPPSKALGAFNTKVTADDVELFDRYFEATPTPVLTVALEQFGAFIANPGDPAPFLDKIQAENEKYWKNR